MAGKKEHIGPVWATLRKNGLDPEPAVSLKSNVYLGCAQREIVPDMDLLFAKREMMTRLCHGTGSGKPEGTNIPDLRASIKEYVPNFLASEKPKPNKKKAALRAVNSLDIPGNCHATVSGGQTTACSSSSKGEISSYSYEMFGHCHQTVDKYLELSGKPRESFKTKAATPCIDDHLIPPEEFEVKGVLAQAARIVLKALYVARITRL